MRVALKIAYDGQRFFGHQRQPDRRTVEGECLEVLRSAKILRDPSFRRGMVRRIVAAMVAYARGRARLAEIRAALAGTRHDFGAAAPEPLFLMDVRYDFPFQTLLKPKVSDEWRAFQVQAHLRIEWLHALEVATHADPRVGSALDSDPRWSP